MTKRKARAKRSPKTPGARHFGPVCRSSKRQDVEVTVRLNAVYGARPEDSAVDPLLSELQIRSLREEW
jgi:hypothetical protein